MNKTKIPTEKKLREIESLCEKAPCRRNEITNNLVEAVRALKLDNRILEYVGKLRNRNCPTCLVKRSVCVEMAEDGPFPLHTCERPHLRTPACLKLLTWQSQYTAGGVRWSISTA